MTYEKIKLTEVMQGAVAVQHPFSPDEHSAMLRYLAGIRKQLQDVSELFNQRYGKDSRLAESALKTLAASTLLEHELLLVEGGLPSHSGLSLEAIVASHR